MGFVDSSNEHIILTCQGAIKARSIRRHDITEMLNAELLNKVQGTHGNPYFIQALLEYRQTSNLTGLYLTMKD